MTYVSIVRSIPSARAKLVAAVVALLMGGSIALSLSATSSPPARADLAPMTRDASAAATRTAMMRIVPAPVIDPSDEVFIGTGDYSNGSWVRP